MKYLKSKQRGFSLVELSVVLTIIGITLAGALDLATRKTESDRITETNARLDAIENAIKVFVVNNQRLPCPADPSLALTSGTSAKEGAPTATGCTGGATNYHNTTNGSYIYQGAVPTKTLGLPDKMIADDWDRRFTYVVDYRFTLNSSTAGVTCASYLTASGAQYCFKNTTITSSATDAKDQTDILVNDSTANSSSSRTAEAVYVIISHGKNGYGAFSYGSTTTATQLAQPASPDADEVSNAATSNATIDATFVQADTSTTFDDILRYKTKALIIDGVSGITDSTTCTAAADNLADIAFYNANGVTQTSTTTTNPCVLWTPSLHDNTNCDLLAAQVDRFCLQP